MSNKDTQDTPLRKASTPYKLKLNKDTKLPDPADLFAVEESIIENNSYFNYKTINFKGRTVTIRSGWPEHYDQEINMIKDYLLVSCNCGSEVIRLCPHVTRLFTRMIERKDHEFFEYFKKHPFSDPIFFDKYLTLKPHYEHDVKAVPKPEYGHIYNFEDDINAEIFASYHSFCLSPTKIEEEESTIVAYAIAAHYDFSVPFLIPCRAIINTEKKDVKSFGNFYDPALAPERLNSAEKLLHSHSVDFSRLLNFEKAHKQSRYVSNEEKTEMQQIAFNEWKRIIPTLKGQKHLFYHRFHQKLPFKGNLAKNTMRPISLANDLVSFSFKLSEHEGHYQLRYNACVNGQDAEVDEVLPPKEPFFFSLKHAPGIFYQFFSLEEGKAIGELVKAGGIFTILQKDFKNFNKDILSKLALNYPITFQLAKETESMILIPKSTQIRVEDKGEYVAFMPTIVYSEGFEVAVQSGGTEMLQFKNGLVQVLQRDKANEMAFKTFFMAMHPAFKKQDALPYFYLSKDTIRNEFWFPKTIHYLNDPNVSFTGMESLTGIDFQIELPDISVNLKEEKGWFDVEVSVTFGKIKLSPEEIQKALKSRTTTLYLPNGKMAHLPDSFFNQLTSVFRSGTLTRKGVKLAGQHYTLIDQLYNKTERPNLANMVAEREKLFSEQEKIPLVPVPDNVNAVLRPYQLMGYSWMCHLHSLKWGGLLADDMGLGKTLQVLTLLQHLKNNGLSSAPHLLIVPTSLLYNWQDEADKFCPELNVLIFHGADREKKVSELMKYDLIITSYGTAAVDVKFLCSIKYHCLILDEAQAIKNPFSQKFKMVTLFEAQNRLALTGTPVENSASDLYALMNFVNPGFFGSMKMFKDNLSPKGDDQDVGRTETLLKMTKPFILRRTKKQVVTDLPPKTEMTLWCEMEPAQRKIYDQYRKRFKAYLTDKIDAIGLENSKLYVLDGLMKLRQICNSPVLMKDAPAFEETSCKIAELMEHIMEKTTGHKLLVFSNFTGMLTLIRTELEKQGIPYAYLDGKTKLDKRKAAATTFQEDEACRVFLISLKAGGTGLNLTAADYVYLVDPWWNPAVENQAIDRCYRIGQDKHVMAYRMICKGTLEEKILAIQDKKRKLAGELIPTDAGILKSFGKDDLLKLFG
ncbi:DEAD/DEAH box helicase [Pedobacter gandavensis]|uniref:DEAD/DEAH box helicase n=1 Tax=Pedobacter gandavensis TaxID=2679963 RepID=UPI00292EAC2A|nr:DEAD/DEAH box helicase [Pedobacter gandavensis]